MTIHQPGTDPESPRSLRPYGLVVWTGLLTLLSGVGLTLGALAIVPWLLNPMAWSHVALSLVLLGLGAAWWVRHYRRHGRKGRPGQRRSGWAQSLLWASLLLSGLFFFPAMGNEAAMLAFRWVHGLLALAALAGFAVHTGSRRRSNLQTTRDKTSG